MISNRYLKFITIFYVIILTYPSIAAESTGMPQMTIPDFMPQLVWLLIIFTLLYFSMKFIALPRITEIKSSRDLKIVNDLNKAEEIKNQIDAANKEHQEAIKLTNDKIKDLVNLINNKSIKDAEIKLEECQKNINQKIEQEKIKLEKEVNNFNKNIEKISSEAVESIIEKIYYTKPEITNLKKVVSKYAGTLNNE
jgi:F-type H+-transporting ATPase subunit b